MAFGSKQKKQRLLVISAGRVLIAVCVALSFLATLVPTGFSSPPPIMDCCVGHEAGSCSSGLLASTNVAQPDAFGHHQDEPRTVFEVSAGVHAQPDETPAPSQAKESKPSRVDNESRACTGECGVCSTSLNRQPRPREHSTHATKARLNLQTSSQIRYAENLHVNTLQRVATQLRPRAPPPLSV